MIQLTPTTLIPVTQNGQPVSIPLDSVISVWVSDHQQARLTSIVTATSTFPGSDWPHGLVGVAFATGELALLSGTLSLSVAVNGTAYHYPATVSGESSAIFPTQAIAVSVFKTGLSGLPGTLSDIVSKTSDSVIWRSVKAAEKEVSRRLGVYLSPVEVFPDEPAAAEIAALHGRPYEVEPGYDMPPGFFGPQSWGSLQLRLRPVIEILSMKLQYPNQGGATFEIPINWLRIDKPYGYLHVYPSAQVVTAPLSVFVMQALGAGNNVPNMIRVRYRAGLQNVPADYPDVLQLVLRGAAINFLDDAFVPQSESISADGLSQSQSADVSAFRDAFEKRLVQVRQQLNGPVWGVL